MKKGKFLSVLTSAAMAGSMMLGALSTTVSAAVPFGLKMTTDKTSYKAGERATVNIEVTGTISQSDHIGNMRFELKPEKWGQTDVQNLILVEENGLATDKGSTVWNNAFNPSSTNTYSTWTSKAEYNAANDEPGYGILNIYDSDGENFVYDDAHAPTVSIGTDSNHGFFKTTGTGTIAQFVVDIPASLPDGKYAINFQNATAGVFPSGDFGADDSVMTNITDLQTGYIVVGEGESTTTTTTKVTTTTSGDVPDVPHAYDGTATIRGQKGVEGAPGDTVYLPVYVELGANVNPATISGIGFQAIYDKSKLELQDIITVGRTMKTLVEGVTGNGLVGGAPEANVDEAIYMNKTGGTDDMTVDSSNPVCLYKFKIKDGVSGEVPVTFVNHLHGSALKIEIVHTQETGKENTYLDPIVVDGSIKVGAAETSVATTAAKIYDGKATIRGEKGVKGTPGEKVYVPVYIELGADVTPATIAGIGFQAIYDKSKLVLSDIVITGRAMKLIDPKYTGAGLSNGAPEFNKDEDVYINKPSGTDDMEVDSSNPMCLLEFTVKDGASGEIPITFVNHLEGAAKPIEIVHTQETGKENTYLEPVVVDGSVVIDAATTTTTEMSTNKVTEETTPVTVTSVVTSISYIESIVTVTSVVPVEVTSIREVTTFVPVESYVPVTSITLVQSVVGTYTVITSISVVPVTSVQVVTSIDPVVQTSYVDRVVTSIVEKEVPVDRIVTSVVEKEVPVVSISIVDREVPYNVTVTSIVEKEVPVDRIVTSIVEKEVPVVSVSISEVEVIKYITEPITSTSVTETTPVQETQISFEIIGSDDIENNDTHWYYEDEPQWHLDGIKVYVDGEEQTVTADDLVFSFDGNEGATPGSVYNKGAAKTNDFEVTVAYGEATTTFKVKIGFRGDVDLSHAPNVRDAAAIAKDLAQISMSNKTTLKSKFAIFLGNVYGGAAKANTRDAYKPYDFTVRGAAAIASWKAKQPFNGGDSYTLAKHLNIKYN